MRATYSPEDNKLRLYPETESPEIAAMHPDAPEWWRVHGDAIKAVIRCVMEKAKAEAAGKGG